MISMQQMIDSRYEDVRLKHSLEHDLAEHSDGELLMAAHCFLNEADGGNAMVFASESEPLRPLNWPFEPESWAPRATPIDNLIEAAVLIKCEAERLLAIDNGVDAVQESEIHHVIEFNKDGWSLMHPSRCRRDGALLDCSVHNEVMAADQYWFAMPVDEAGRYRVVFDDNGRMEFRELDY